MSDTMNFPKTIEEFIKQYSLIDKEQIYTNGSELIPTFRVEQALEHYYKTNKYKFQDKPIKLCPFRKQTRAYYYQSEEHPKVETFMERAEWTEEEFMPCLKGKCQSYYEENIGYTTPRWVSCCKLMVK